MGLIPARVTAVSAAALAGLLLILAFAAAWVIGWGPHELVEHGLASIPWIAVGFVPTGAVLAWQRPRNPIGWLLVATGFVASAVVVAIPGTVLAVERGWPMWLQVTLANISFSAWSLWLILIPLALLRFPHGRLDGWLARAVATVVFVAGIGIMLLSLADPMIGAWLAGLGTPIEESTPDAGSLALLGDTVLSDWTGLLAPLFVVGSVGFVGVVVVLVARFARGDDHMRRQLFWILLAVLTSAALLGTGVVAITLGPAFGLLALLPPPIGIMIAIVRVNLFDVKLVFSRALAWGILTVILVSAFFALVAVLGALLVQTASAVVAALGVALVFDPLRRWLQRTIDRLIYGRRSEPVYLVELVGSGMSQASDLQSVIRRLADSLKLPWLAIRTNQRTVAESGNRPEVVETFPLLHGDDDLGSLEVGLRRGEGGLGRFDREVVGLLAPLLAILLRLTTVSEDLVASRGRIVEATEEERRRVQRDLHDGVASALGGIAFKIEGIRNQVHGDPNEVAELLAEVHADVVRASSTLREVIHDLRPPELDTLGLVDALRQATAALRSPRAGRQPVVTVRSDPERMPLPAAIELAAYRIGVEATANALRHSTATEVTIDLACAASVMEIRVHDNGAAQGHWTMGVGLRSMRDRAELLGGRFRAWPGADGGTVEVVIPIHEVVSQDA